ncbi:MAG: DUF1365 domain-containing protein [Rhodospirillaceae bacterium]|nr:DUF1365 domain-containing protein [Rhodospirillaceae bacterium]
MVTATRLLDATIFHERHYPVRHSLHHKVCYFVLNMADISRLQHIKSLSLNRFNFLSVYEKDYGFDATRSWEAQLKETLSQHHLPIPAQIVLMTLPRLLGYVFNPVSFWFCFDDKQNLYAVLAEVNNTFGECHGYLCALKEGRFINAASRITIGKNFHVSPFCDIKGEYEFSFDLQNTYIDVHINYKVDGKSLISTVIKGPTQALSNQNIKRYFWCRPWNVAKVILLIHYHGLCLFLKGLKYRPKPSKPNNNVN